MRSAVCKISNVTYPSYQRARTNHHPFLVLIMRDNYRGEPQTKLPPHRLQSPVFRESLHLLHSIVSLSLYLKSSLCVFSLVLASLFSSAVSHQRRIMHAGVFPASYKENLGVKTCVIPPKQIGTRPAVAAQSQRIEPQVCRRMC